MAPPGPIEEPALAWLDSGLYKLLFNVSVKNAVIDAENKLSKAKTCGLMDAGASDTQVMLRRLDSAVKCVTAVAHELSHSAVLWQLLMQLLLLSTIKKILQCSQQLEDSLFDLPSQPSAPLHTPGPEPPRTPQPGLLLAEQAALAAAAAAAADEDSFSCMQFAVPVRMVPWQELAIQKPLGQGAYGTVFAASLKGTQGGGAAAAAAALAPSSRSNSSSQLLQAGISSSTSAVAGPGSRHGSTQRLNSGSLLASVLHCDLRAPNLLLSGLRPDSWSIKVADFGLAQWTGEDGETALTDTVTNRLWLAPEVLHSPEATGDGCFVVSKAADVYSFGCIMYEVLTGRLPFETDSIHQQMLEVIGGFGDPVGHLGPLHWPHQHDLQHGFNTPELLQLQPLFESCVDVNPAARPSFEQKAPHPPAPAQQQQQQQQQQ
ncbi:hypothetical protein OEZ85_002542 [Tetradesmus obliquus]|uniref:Protein kinase domain-containing protein n=1 Tax=Tetradesmus obliquus TaxID=3088 RepID=A0ABY8TXU2_TETOB|nr:hypothetical protein OEZ85_002542 [Tetradesmus obliquus]